MMTESAVDDNFCRVSKDTFEEIKRSFQLMDENGDGKLSLEEIMQAACGLGLNPTEEEAQAMLLEADTDGDGFINFVEYVNVMSVKYSEIDVEHARMIAAFQTLDTNEDGKISVDELRSALLYNKSYDLYDDRIKMEIENFLQEADTNGDGMVDYVEFVKSTLCTKVF